MLSTNQNPGSWEQASSLSWTDKLTINKTNADIKINKTYMNIQSKK